MLLDKQNLMINNVLVTAMAASTTYTADPSAGTPLVPGSLGSVGSIDLGTTVPNRRKTGLKVFAMITGATVAGTASLAVNIYNSATPSAATTLLTSSGTITAATMVAGYEFPIDLIESQKLILQYLVCTVVTGAGTPTGVATLHVGLVPEGDAQTANYPT